MNAPFRRLSSGKEGKIIGYNVKESVGLRQTKGVIGLELECEGHNLPIDEEEVDIEDYVSFSEMSRGVWNYHKDYSLRGEENAEYVLAKPLEYDETMDAIDDLFKILKECDAHLDISNRTSLHVHLNCQEFTARELASFSAVYFALEEVLSEFCGEHRVGNLFCLRGIDAPAIVTETQKFIANGLSGNISDHYHYAGFNIQALQKFGSIEIRTMRGLTTAEECKEWVSILYRIYEFAKSLDDPREVCYMFSAKGPVAFAKAILGDFYDKIVSTIGWDEDAVRRSLYTGIRLAQGICYRTLAWDRFEAAKPDVFGRSKKRVLDDFDASYAFDEAVPAPAPILSTIDFPSYQVYVDAILSPPSISPGFDWSSVSISTTTGG